MKRAVILTENSYPEGDAGAVRQHSFAKLLDQIGYDVLVIGYGKPTNKETSIYDGIKYISFRSNRKSKISRFWKRLTFGNEAISYIKKNYRSLDLLFVVDLMPDIFKKIEKLKDKYNCTLVHDSVEWYSKEEFKLGKLDPAFIRKEFTNTRAINKRWNVVAISSYLETHFKHIANEVVRIPVIMDINNIEFRTNTTNCEKIIFSYAGGPGKKDYLKEILDGFSMLKKSELEKIQLNIIGVTRNQLVNICEVEESTIRFLEPILKIHGRVERKTALELIKLSDYSLLIRDENLRYAKAGFPTKIVESLSCGTPPLCNCTSDLGSYLIDKYNSIIANGHTAEDVCNAVRKSLSIIGIKGRENMRINARNTAKMYFDYSNYATSLTTVCER